MSSASVPPNPIHPPHSRADAAAPPPPAAATATGAPTPGARIRGSGANVVVATDGGNVGGVCDEQLQANQTQPKKTAWTPITVKHRNGFSV